MILQSCNPIRCVTSQIICIISIICNHPINLNIKVKKTYLQTGWRNPKTRSFSKIARKTILQSCNPIRCVTSQSSASSQSSAIIQQTWTPKWRKHTYKQAKEIPKLVIFRRSHVRRSCNPAIRSGALHRTSDIIIINRHSHMLFLVPDPWSRTQ